MKKENLKELALVTIDMQRDTRDGKKLEIPGTSQIIPNLARITETARKKGIPIIHIVRIYLEDGSNAEPVRKKIILSGNKILAPFDEGTEIFQETLPNPDIKLDCDNLLKGNFQKIGDHEYILYKSRWGAFYETQLHDFLQELSVQSLCFIGVNFPNCPRTSIYEASERDYNVYAVSDAISGIYERGEKELRSIGVEFISTDDFVNL